MDLSCYDVGFAACFCCIGLYRHCTSHTAGSVLAGRYDGPCVAGKQPAGKSADTYTADEQGELQERCRVLENQGLAVAVYQDGQIVYATDGSDPWQTIAAAQKKIAGQQTGTDTVNPDTDTAAMIWKENTLAYLYMSRSTGVQVAAVSQEAIAMPREYKGMYPLHMQQTWVWLSIVWLCISCFLVWIVLSKRIIKKMIPYVPLRLDMQQQKQHGSGHRQDRDHPDASAHNRQ